VAANIAFNPFIVNQYLRATRIVLTRTMFEFGAARGAHSRLPTRLSRGAPSRRESADRADDRWR